MDCHAPSVPTGQPLFLDHLDAVLRSISLLQVFENCIFLKELIKLMYGCGEEEVVAVRVETKYYIQHHLGEAQVSFHVTFRSAWIPIFSY
jgi:hypothetical protein